MELIANVCYCTVVTSVAILQILLALILLYSLEDLYAALVSTKAIHFQYSIDIERSTGPREVLGHNEQKDSCLSCCMR